MKFIVLDFGTAQKEALRLRQGSRIAVDMYPAMKRIEADIFEIERQQFYSQGRRGGGSWKPLKSRTTEKKGQTQILITSGARKGYGSGISRLRTSVIKKDAPENVSAITKTSISFGTTVPYAAAMQWGNPGKQVPARPFIKFTNFDIDRWIGYMEEHVMKAYRASSNASIR